ncbi:hypothetical protein [Tepidibacillus decaturensis]|nr:hypothetical protein [Tepidibacillus decaturensis]
MAQKDRYLIPTPDNHFSVFVLLLILIALGFFGKLHPIVPNIPIG